MEVSRNSLLPVFATALDLPPDYFEPPLSTRNACCG